MRMNAEQRIASRYIPQGSTKLDAPEADLIVYLYEDREGRPCAMGYSKTRSKSDFHNVYQSEELRLKRINDLRQSCAKAKEDKHQAKKSKPHDLKPGAIFVWSWGYDQTNVNFYQVVSTTPHTVNVREIAQESVEGGGYGSMSDHRIAVPDEFLERESEMRKRVQFSQNEPYLSMNFGWCGLWNGKPRYNSWYA